jgi:hypothetical protein
METNIRIESSKQFRENVKVMNILTEDGDDSLRMSMMSHLSDAEMCTDDDAKDHIEFVKFLLLKFMPSLRVNIDYEFEQFLNRNK